MELILSPPLAGQVTASVLMADQDDVFIVQIHKPLQGCSGTHF